ncbi:HDOD domain-containing protein [Rhodocyclus tenuis]|uniref:HDOD domain-containing protein n=2 Tax=Rhodocyclus TaxID=1064 RepID=A0A6L5JT69_RHOTE|nr:HDOD domain-containing protein [Rhodocyclus gracilis]MQY50585.1 HDOD domain-containing protein [Rhodocyclus gracilis]MRD72588.1 HDOD domain-containing protein [Rhodocyclus gracilis]NJA88114.1 HDOD domain-containing protein [Rhodocyclus gracilis]
MNIDKGLLASLEDDEARKLTQLMDQGIRIPPQPRVLTELARLVTSGVDDVRRLAATIAEDPGISALLFKAVQSPVFRAHQPFTSVVRILQVVGVSQTTNLVRAIALSAGSAGGKGGQQMPALEAFWARSRAVAQIAMLIAEDRVSVCNIFPDQAYLAGVFHDCGVAVLMQRFPDYCKALRLDEPGHWPNLAEEDQRFSADHSVVGFLVARHWKLPEFVCDAIRYHHDFSRLEDHSARTMIAILQLAIHIYALNSALPSPDWAANRGEVADELGIHDEALAEFIDVILERYQEH